MDQNNSPSLVRHAFCEQRNLKLGWFKKINGLKELLQNQSQKPLLFPSSIRQQLLNRFESLWDIERRTNKKLTFYNNIKESFSEEPCLSMNIGYKNCKRLEQFRTSCHSYNIETGRYGNKRSDPINRLCRHCSTDDDDTLRILFELPMFEPVVEDEQHILQHCSLYSEIRSSLTEETRSFLGNGKIKEVFQNTKSTLEIAKFLKRCHEKRFPKKEEEEGSQKPAGAEDQVEQQTGDIP